MLRPVLVLALVASVAAYCDLPPSLWCSSYETAVKCQVTDQCLQWLQTRRQGQQAATKPVDLTLYYESLCPDCLQFFHEQLWPTYKKLVGTGILNITLVPYGNARESKEGGAWKFDCQHGSEECRGNVLETCAIHYLKDQRAYVPFIHCMESHMADGEAPDAAAKSCCSSMGVDITYSRLKACADGRLGNQLEHQMAAKTDALNPPHQYVPWITLYGVHTEAMEKRAESDLLNLVCDSYQGAKPAACGGAAGRHARL